MGVMVKPEANQHPIPRLLFVNYITALLYHAVYMPDLQQLMIVTFYKEGHPVIFFPDLYLDE